MMPLAKGATKLVWARSSQGSRSTSNLLLTMAWKAAMTSRACTSDGAPLDCRDDDRLGFGKPVAGDCHKTGDCSGRRSATDSADVSLVRLSPACGPFRDHPKTAAKALLFELSP